MKIEATREEGQERKSYRPLMITSGATTTSLIEDDQFYFVHGGRQPEALELGGDSSFVVYIGSVSALKEMRFDDWRTCVWRANKFGRMSPSTSEQHLGWPPAAIMHSVIALSRANVDEPENVENVSEAVSAFAGASPEAEFETFPWRGTYCLAHTEKILFLQNVEFKTSDLPRWKPRVTIDRHRP